MHRIHGLKRPHLLTENVRIPILGLLLHRRARLLAGFVVSGVWERRQNNSFELLAGSYGWFRLAAWNARLPGGMIKVSLERNVPTSVLASFRNESWAV